MDKTNQTGSFSNVLLIGFFAALVAVAIKAITVGVLLVCTLIP